MTIKKESRTKLPLPVTVNVSLYYRTVKQLYITVPTTLIPTTRTHCCPMGPSQTPSTRSAMAKVGVCLTNIYSCVRIPFPLELAIFIFIIYFFCRMVRLLYTLPPRKTRWKSLRCWPLMAPCWITRMQ